MRRPHRSYLICSTQRSGSTYLCHLLAGTGAAGNPQEYFEARAETGLPPHPAYFLAGLPRTGAGIRDDLRPTDAPSYSDLRTVDGWEAHLERTFRTGTTPNGVFGTKLMWNQLPDVEQHATAVRELAGLTGIELLECLFGNPGYVWMRRRDKVRQAISLWRALQTRTWRLEHPGRDAERPELHYSFEGIDHLRRRLSADDESWGRFFLASGVDPLEISYEDDVEPDPAGAVARIHALVGIEVPTGWEPQAEMVRQSDGINDAWRSAYDRDAGGNLAGSGPESTRSAMTMVLRSRPSSRR